MTSFRYTCSMHKKPKPRGKMVKFTLYLPLEIRKALRIRAVEEGVSATKLVEQVLLDHLKKKGAA